MVDKTLPILIVDDYNMMRGIVRGLLKQLGFENADEASDGKEALARLREKKYGLVISDWNMQPMTGLDLLKNVRGDTELKHTPFIMATSENKPEHLLVAKQAGVSNYLVKPFNADMLKAKMVSVLGVF
jgi:two-component system chemotaxis response regulator CheY